MNKKYNSLFAYFISISIFLGFMYYKTYKDNNKPFIYYVELSNAETKVSDNVFIRINKRKVVALVINGKTINNFTSFEWKSKLPITINTRSGKEYILFDSNKNDLVDDYKDEHPINFTR